MPYSRKYRLSLLVLLIGFKLMANNDTLNFKTVESATYNYYLSKNWKALLQLSDAAIKNNIDYYYLRIRAGIGAFELKQYRLAITHFNKALEFNDGDETATEYLYYCYFYCGREEHMRKLAGSLNKSMAKYLETSALSRISVISVDGGVKLADSTDKFGPAIFSQVSANLYLSPRLSFFQSFNFSLQEESRFSFQQFQYYLRNNLALKKSITLYSGAHLFYTNSAVKEYTVVQKTEQPPPPTPGAPPPPPRTFTTLESTDAYYQALGFAAGLSAIKHTSLFDYSAGLSLVVLDTATQYQASGGITWYPLKNNKLLFGCTAYLHSADNFGSVSLAYSPYATVWLGKKFNLGLSYFSNNGLNISENTVSFVNNSYDYTRQRALISPNYFIKNRFSLYGLIGWENKARIEDGVKYNYIITQIGLRYYPFKKTKTGNND